MDPFSTETIPKVTKCTSPHVHTGSKSKGEGVMVTWDNPEELEGYIHKLQAAADRLTSENRRLRKCHNIVCDKVSWVFVKG